MKSIHTQWLSSQIKVTIFHLSNISSQDWVDNCYKSINDDFNSPKLIANFFDLIKIINEIKLDNI